MSKEAMITELKRILALAKAGNHDEAYAGYTALFQGADFTGARPEDQRKVLELMVLSKHTPPKPTKAMLEAHRAALPALTELVSVHGEPSDHELLGITHVLLGNEAAASNIFKAGLATERQRNAASDLCGRLMNRMSAL